MSNPNAAQNAINLQNDLASRIAELETMQDELKRLKAEQKKMLRLKVSQKGAVSVYGLNSRFPLTLYANQWERLISEVVETGTLQTFIEQNNGELARK
jgi:uncharacterized small protein (DUF1192 family)